MTSLHRCIRAYDTSLWSLAWEDDKRQHWSTGEASGRDGGRGMGQGRGMRVEMLGMMGREAQPVGYVQPQKK